MGILRKAIDAVWDCEPPQRNLVIGKLKNLLVLADLGVGVVGVAGEQAHPPGERSPRSPTVVSPRRDARIAHSAMTGASAGRKSFALPTREIAAARLDTPSLR